MSGLSDGPAEFKEHSYLKRVSVIPEYNCKGKKYILLIYNTSRKEWETPGGKSEGDESVDATARRELSEELGQNIDAFNICEIHTDQFNASLRLDIYYSREETKQGANLLTTPVLARTEVEELPVQLPLSSEHSDFMFFEIPDWGHTYRHDFISMIRQFKSRKLVFAKKHLDRVFKLRMTDDPYEIEGRPRNISKISSLALLAYLQASFDKQI